MKLNFKTHGALKADSTEESQESGMKAWFQTCAEKVSISYCASWVPPVSPASKRCKNTTRRKLANKLINASGA